MLNPPLSERHHIGVLLAGGLSSRMGQNKADLFWCGKTLKDFSVDLLASAGCQSILISGGHWPESIPDRIPACGPVAGLYSVLQFIDEKRLAAMSPEPFLWVIPVDMPLLTAQQLHALVSHAQQSDADAVCFKHHPLPLVLRLNVAVREAMVAGFERILVNEFPSIRSVLANLNWQVLVPSEEDIRCLANVNTPQAWRALFAGCASHLTD